MSDTSKSVVHGGSDEPIRDDEINENSTVDTTIDPSANKPEVAGTVNENETTGDTSSDTPEIATSYLVEEQEEKTSLGMHIMRLPSVIKESPRTAASVATLGLLILAAGAYTLFGPGLPGSSSTRDTSAVVARVNGINITEAELDKRVSQVEQTLASQLGTSSAITPEMKSQVLEELINLELLNQGAKKAGFEASETDVDAEVARVTELLGGEEQLETQLVLVGLTKDDLRSNIKSELGIRTYLEANTDVGKTEVSDDELRALYEAQFAGATDAPPFDEVKPYLEQQAVQEKSGAILQEFIEKLKGEATIENPAL